MCRQTKLKKPWKLQLLSLIHNLIKRDEISSARRPLKAPGRRADYGQQSLQPAACKARMLVLDTETFLQHPQPSLLCVVCSHVPISTTMTHTVTDSCHPNTDSQILPSPHAQPG